MKIGVSYTKRIHYKDAQNGLKQWFFYFRKYQNIRGFIMRICGVYFNIRENNATQKLVAKMSGISR